MRSDELGDFLRSRRARVDPATVGFPTDRRRTPGLRREELAAIAGVTVSWVAKLEQGQARAVSSEVLDALAGALRLSNAERTHLFKLAGYRIEIRPDAGATVTEALSTLLNQFDTSPAYLLDRCWNMIAWNKAEAWLFANLCSTEEPPNLLEMVFTDHDLELLMADYDEECERLVSQFRHHVTDWAEDPGVTEVIERLSTSSPRFASLWNAKDVSPFNTTRRVFVHPTAGRLEFDHHRLAVLDQPGMQLVVYTAAPGSTTLHHLEALRCDQSLAGKVVGQVSPSAIQETPTLLS